MLFTELSELLDAAKKDLKDKVSGGMSECDTKSYSSTLSAIDLMFATIKGHIKSLEETLNLRRKEDDCRQRSYLDDH